MSRNGRLARADERGMEPRMEPRSRLPRVGKFGNMICKQSRYHVTIFCVGAGGWRC